MVGGRWLAVDGGWRLVAVGDWRLVAVGSRIWWGLAVGGWWSLGAVLTRKIGIVQDSPAQAMLTPPAQGKGQGLLASIAHCQVGGSRRHHRSLRRRETTAPMHSVVVQAEGRSLPPSDVAT